MAATPPNDRAQNSNEGARRAAIGRQLRWARRRAGLTQHELARAADMPQSNIARIERGTVSPRTDTLVRLLDATGHRLAVEPTDTDIDRAPIRRRLAISVPRRTSEALGQKGTKQPRTGPIGILRRLRRHAVPFVLIGDLAEVVHGVPNSLERPIEVCHATTDVARERLATAMTDVDASTVRLLTHTVAGDEYEVLRRNAVDMHVAAGMVVKVAAIPDLIRARRAGTTPEDAQVAATLLAIEDDGHGPGTIGG
jgi:transcriptional regulator with XRE-family HTH domain